MWWSKMKPGIWVIGVMLTSLLLAGCGADAGAEQLASTEWELDELNGRDALDDVSVTMRLGTDDELSGSSGCNRYIGSWESGEDYRITLLPGGMTMMLCDEGVMTQETEFLAALAAATTFDLDDDELELYDADGRQVAEFDKLRPAQLTRTQWEVTALNNGQDGVVNVLEDTTLTAVFNTDDNIAGNGGCNTFGADFTRDGNDIDIKPIAGTMMACDQPIMDQEAQFFQALERATTFELGHETLYLRSDDGALQVAFREVSTRQPR